MPLTNKQAEELISYIEFFAEQLMDEQHNVLQDMSRQEHRVLMFVGREKSCTMSTIADYIGLVSSAITVIVSKLVDKGLLERYRPKDDRRKVIVRLTPFGYKHFLIKQQAYIKYSQNLMSFIDEDEQSELLMILRKIAHTTDELPIDH